MTTAEILLLALSMAIDAFAVSLAAGALPGIHGAREAFRLAFHFGLFQFLMPIVGWLAGTSIESLIHDFDHWLAFGLLVFVGARMILAARRSESALPAEPSRGWILVVLSIAVSLDALAVGLSLGLVGIAVGYPALLIGVTTGLLTLLGLRLGVATGRKLGRPAQLFGGLVLIVIGVRIVLQHLML